MDSTGSMAVGSDRFLVSSAPYERKESVNKMRSESHHGIQTLSVRARDAARMLGLSPRTLWALTKANQVPHVRVGRSVLYPVEQLKKWLAEMANRG